MIDPENIAYLEKIVEQVITMDDAKQNTVDYLITKQIKDKEKIERYRDHRYVYFKFVVELGQTENLKKITCPVFVLQGSMDQARYKTSSMMLMDFVSSDVTQRKDYAQSRHLLLLEGDRKEAFKDIREFFDNN